MFLVQKNKMKQSELVLMKMRFGCFHILVKKKKTEEKKSDHIKTFIILVLFPLCALLMFLYTTTTNVCGDPLTKTPS